MPDGANVVVGSDRSGWRNERKDITANYTILASDNGKTLVCASASDAIQIAMGNVTALPVNFVVTILNANAPPQGRGVWVITTGNRFLFPEQSGTWYREGSSWRVLPIPRHKLWVALTIFVSYAGLGINDGAVAGSPTVMDEALARAMHYLDFGQQTVTIKLADGTYPPIVLASANSWTGGGLLKFSGNTSTPANVIISGNNTHAISVTGPLPTKVHFEGLTLTTVTSGNCVVAQRSAQLEFGLSMRFGACVNTHLAADRYGQIELLNNYEIFGDAQIHYDSANGALITALSMTVTLTGLRNFSAMFARAWYMSEIVAAFQTFVGTATGARFSASQNGVINTGGAALTYFPGNTTGTLGTGGIWNGLKAETSTYASFKAHKAGTGQGGVLTGMFTQITFPTEVWDKGGYYDAALSRWTPPAGLVRISARITLSGTLTAGTWQYLIIRRNGTITAEVGRISIPASNANVAALELNIEDQANGADYYTAELYPVTSTGTVLISGIDYETQFSGTMI